MNDRNDSLKVVVLEEKVNHHDSRLDKHEIRIDKLEETIPLMSRLEAILEAQVELNRTQSLQMEQSNKTSEKTFQAINKNLTQLNMMTDRLKEDFDESANYSKAEIQAIRKKIEEEENRRKIDTGDWGVKIFYSLAGLIPLIILAYILAKNGWN